MPITHETRRTRWAIMATTWFVCGWLILLHTRAVREYVDLLDKQGVPRVADLTPLRQVIPARYADAQMWVRHVAAAQDAGQARVRFTEVDNAPAGREVHWSSAFGWLVRGAGWLHSKVTGEPMPRALERALLWFNAPLLLVMVVLLSGWAATYGGAGAGMLVALGMVGHQRFYEGFAPTYVDHHGLVTAAVFGLVLGVARMGAGCWHLNPAATHLLPMSRASLRRAAIVSALCGAVGLWLSAASVLPAIVLSGASAFVVLWCHGPEALRQGAVFDPAAWRWWGRTGAVASFVFYLIEYAPSHFSLRLEVNHPFYALAWWGGAEAMALLAGRRLVKPTPPTAPDAEPPKARPGGRKPQGQAKHAPPPPSAGHQRGLWSQLALPLAALLTVPVTILLAGRAAFMIGDPFIGDLRHFVAEGKSLPAALNQFGRTAVIYPLATTLLLIPAIFVWRRSSAPTQIVLGTVTLLTTGLVGMGFAEMRWWAVASGPQLTLVLLVVGAFAFRTASVRWMTIGLVGAGVFLAPAVARIGTTRAENQRRAVAAGDLLQPLYRNISAALRASDPDGGITVLSNPNASAGISYFGRFKTLGTLYWENAPGLRAAAEIFSATTDDEAAQLIRARGVTHLVFVGRSHFIREYFQLLYPSATDAEIQRSFAARLLTAQTRPAWLQPLAYRPPPELAEVAGEVALYKVVGEQPQGEQLFHLAQAQIARGDLPAAERAFEQALRDTPAANRLSLFEAAGGAYYEFGHDAAAIRMFRRALALGFDPNVANTAAWILATTSDATLRDGVAALALVEPIAARAKDDPMVLSTLAAASAEVGRFPEAVRAAERALELVRNAGDAEAVALLQKRLDAYRANRPWRQ